MTQPQCTIIGGGVVGLCIAIELQKRGFQPTIIDGGEARAAASYGNAGFLAEEGIDPLSTVANIRRGLSLLPEKHGALSIPAATWHRSMPWLLKFIAQAQENKVQHNRQALNFLLKQAASSWHELLKECSLSSHLIQTAYLRVWESPAGLVAAQQEQAFYQQWDIAAEIIDHSIISQIAPALSQTINHAILLPHAHRVSDPHLLCLALRQYLVQHGAQLITDHIHAISPSEQGIQLHGTQQNHTSDYVIIAAGSQSHLLSQTIGYTVPLIAERGYHLNLTGQTGLVDMPFCSAERNVFVNPLENGLRITGFSELADQGLPPIMQRYASLQHHLGALMPNTRHLLTQAEQWMGERPTLPDSLPVIGTHPTQPRIGFAFGHQHLGLTLAAVTAKLLVNQMCQQTTNSQLDAYRIDRFG